MTDGEHLLSNGSMTLPALGRDAVVRTLGTTLATSAGLRMWSRQLRILAYHEVKDSSAFRLQMEEVLRRCEPVGGRQVAGALSGRGCLPSRAVWVTFDDGSPTVIEAAQPVLDRLGIKATLFVCPGVITTGEPYWWWLVETARANGLEIPAEPSATDLAVLTSWPDWKRREAVDDLRRLLTSHNVEVNGRQLRREELDGWIAAGHDIGNHSWDHPCLDTCEPSEQRRQVRQAHDWIEQHFDPPTRVFAYPNGNFTPVVEHELRRMGYSIALLFDHRLASFDSDRRLRLSRIRANASTDISRFRAVLSGTHSALYHALSWVQVCI